MNTKMLTLAVLMTAVSVTVRADFQTSYKGGKKAAAQKQYAEALTQYESAAKEASSPGQRYQVFNAMAQTYQQQKDWKNAEATLTKILNDKEISAENRMNAQIFLGDCKMMQRKPMKALQEYQKSLSFGIRNGQRHYALLSCGNLLAGQKKYDEAGKCFQELLDDPQVNATRKNRARIGMGNVLYAQGKYQETIDTMKDTANDPKVPAGTRADALLIIARAQYKLKAYKDACDAYMSIIALDNIPAYFKKTAYPQAISIQAGILKDYAQAKKLLDDYAKMPGADKKWIENYRARISKAEKTL